MNAHTMPSYIDPPFAVPQSIVFDCPIPPSTNKVRRVDWASRPIIKKWYEQTDKLFLLNKQRLRKNFIAGRYQITITLDENKLRIDPGNTEKSLHDLMKRYGLIMDDSKKYCRGIHIVFGEAPEGARVTITPSE